MLFVLFLLYKQHIVHLSHIFCLMEVSILAAIIAFFYFLDDMEMFYDCTREEKEHPGKTTKKTEKESNKSKLF